MARFSWRHQLKHFQQEFRVVAFDNRCVDRLDVRCGDEKELVLLVQKYQGQIRFAKRGYNRSGQPEGIANYALEHLVEDVRGLVQVSKEALKNPEVKIDQLSFQGLGVERCSVVAHDWGGPIAWTFAALYPEMVRDLTTSIQQLVFEN